MNRVKAERRLRKTLLQVDLGQEQLAQHQAMLDFGLPSGPSPRAMWLLRDLKYMQAIHVAEAQCLRMELKLRTH